MPHYKVRHSLSKHIEYNSYCCCCDGFIYSDLYAAYENEYTVFSPMDNCFELFGLDFMVDSSFNTYLLEVNPGPDFKQTGDRLRGVIASLWEDTCTIVLDGKDEGTFTKRNDFRKVYDKVWSAASMKGGGMSLK
jgi:tubulin---tyrosine ligase